MKETSMARRFTWRRRRRGVVTERQEASVEDLLGRAFAREREHGRLAVPERNSVADAVFRCVCCGKMRGDQDRREPRSEVCLRCVQDAGFYN